MRLTFWGTRGSISKAGPSTLRYGGNTSCVALRSDAGTLVVLDCGTGGHGLGQSLMTEAAGRPVNGHILIGHTHWDHIQGLPFFAPLFGPANTWHIYGPRGLGTSIGQTLAGQMQYAYFPVTLDQLNATIGYHDLVEGSFDIEDVRVTTRYLNHPALTLGYRMEVDGVTVVYSSDHEPHEPGAAGGSDVAANVSDARHIEFLRGADLVIHDAQYLADEYPAKLGWGHSPMEYVVGAAHAAGVGRLALYHHDPCRDDAAVDAVVERARRFAADLGYVGEIFAAAEGAVVELRGAPEGRLPAVRRASRATAMDEPLLSDQDRSVLISVSEPEIAGALRSAVEAEGLWSMDAADPASAIELARVREPSIIIVEESSARGLAEAVRSGTEPYSSAVGIIGVTSRAGRGTDAAVTDWLVWPSTSVYVRTKLRAWVLRQACRWQNAPFPADESSRLEALRALRILDTDPEERFDRLTAMASALLDVPVALVSLVDKDRQWFKSSFGMTPEESPRDLSVCAHAILGDDVFCVPDMFADERFADHPGVVGAPRMRFYAGVPLKLSDGHTVGTLCVIDHRPRVLDAAQLDELRYLGRLVVGELEASAAG